VLFGEEGEGSEFVELVIVGAMGAVEMGIFFGVAFAVLDQTAAEAGDQFAPVL
jgi:hypothetical protein